MSRAKKMKRLLQKPSAPRRRRRRNAGPTVTLTDCVVEGNEAGGVIILPGAHVASLRGKYRDNGGADVDNHGRFESTEDQIGADDLVSSDGQSRSES